MTLSYSQRKRDKTIPTVEFSNTLLIKTLIETYLGDL